MKNEMADMIGIKKPEMIHAEAINHLIIDVFMKCIAPYYSREGIDAFLNVCTKDKVKEKLGEGSPMYMAESGHRIVGILMMRNKNHISRFFIDVAHQRAGIGRMLFTNVLSEIHSLYAEIKEITVNSSPCALTAYERMGFQRTSEEKVDRGLKYIDMVYPLCI